MLLWERQMLLSFKVWFCLYVTQILGSGADQPPPCWTRVEYLCGAVPSPPPWAHLTCNMTAFTCLSKLCYISAVKHNIQHLVVIKVEKETVTSQKTILLMFTTMRTLNTIEVILKDNLLYIFNFSTSLSHAIHSVFRIFFIFYCTLFVTYSVSCFLSVLCVIYSAICHSFTLFLFQSLSDHRWQLWLFNPTRCMWMKIQLNLKFQV